MVKFGLRFISTLPLVGKSEIWPGNTDKCTVGACIFGRYLVFVCVYPRRNEII